MRRRHRARRQRLQRWRVERASAMVCDHLQRRWSARKLEHVAGYAALGCEIDVRAYLESSLERGVAVYLPRVTGPGAMEFGVVEDFDTLQRGAFGIEEPSGPAVDSDVIEIFLVPGLAFDRRGRRLGFGKGFYDRALPAVGQALVVGVGFDWQVVGEVPAEAHDRPMDAVVTEAGWVEVDADAASQE